MKEFKLWQTLLQTPASSMTRLAVAAIVLNDAYRTQGGNH